MCEWDARKAAVNAMKHGVTFGEAATVFDDPQGLDGPDLAHSGRERRYRRLGRTASGRLLIVGYTRRRLGDVENIRIITARPPSRRERATYTSARD